MMKMNLSKLVPFIIAFLTSVLVATKNCNGFIHHPLLFIRTNNDIDYMRTHLGCHQELNHNIIKEEEGRGEGEEKENHHHQHNLINRRTILSQSLLGITSPFIFSQSASATSTSSSRSSNTRITNYPSLEYLEPIYELKLSIQSLQQVLQNNNNNNNPNQYSFIQKRLNKMFQGGPFSEKNYYLGLAVTYNNQIQYSDGELQTFINLDKDERFNLIDSTLKSLELLKDHLKSYNDTNNNNKGNNSVVVNDNNNNSIVVLMKNDINDAERFITKWFDLVPNEDVNAVASLFKMTREADVNRDGRLDGAELAILPEKEREIWLKRIALVGD